MRKKKKILITGITGQDGVFLTKDLLDNKNYEIIGTSRRNNFDNFNKKIGILNFEIKRTQNLKIINIDLTNKLEVNKFIKDIKFDYVYNLAGPSSVYDSINNPVKSKFEISTIFNNLIDSFIEEKYFPNFFQASSSEMFNKEPTENISEEAELSPTSPYGVAKAKIHQDVKEIRKTYDWNISSGIMFNHESELRSNDYLFMKIVNSAIEIKNKNLNNVKLGGLDIQRDWSYAGEVMKAAKLIVESDESEDYVIGSGKPTSIKSLIEFVFNYFDLNYENFLQIDKGLLRPNEPKIKYSSPVKINKKFDWRTTLSVQDILQKCIEQKLSDFSI
tara:strand:- start:2863 stop:3855 length:993 start_codon:yes stop_codon:yes gene_type:complete